VRLALVVPGGVNPDGETRVIPAILWLIERLARRHDVHVLVPRQQPLPGDWDLLGARIHNIGRARWRVAAVRTLCRLHRVQPFDVFHGLWAGAPGQVALLSARICRRPVIVHVMGGELVSLPDIEFGNTRSRGRAAVRFVLCHADSVTAASGVIEELVLEAGVQPVRVALGVDTSCWKPEPPRPRSADRAARVVHVGSLTPVKDHATLLRAVASLTRDGRSVHVDLVGEDASEGAVQRIARTLGVHDRVTFHGFLPQRLAIPVVHAADLMVVSSRHEAGPVAMLEAAAVGVPTVGTAVGHLRDWAPEGAVAVPVGDAAALAREIGRLLDDDSRRLAIARVAQQLALREDADWTCARFEELSAGLIRNGDGGKTRTAAGGTDER
jgi:glycosyltransferase involved in cell wall biosynthesis